MENENLLYRKKPRPRYFSGNWMNNKTITIEGVRELWRRFRQDEELPEDWKDLLDGYIARRRQGKRTEKFKRLLKEAERVKSILSSI